MYHCNRVKNKTLMSPRPRIPWYPITYKKFSYYQQVGIGQYQPTCSMKMFSYYKQVGIGQYQPTRSMKIFSYYKQVGICQYQPTRSMKIFHTTSRLVLANTNLFVNYDQDISVFIFHSITMLMAWGWLGGIGEFPPHPSRLRQYLLVPRLRLGTTEALPQPLRIRREFSNTSSPSSRHCII